MVKENLFQDFEIQTKESWLQKIEKDLKGKPLSSLSHQSADGYTISPVYAFEDQQEHKQAFRKNLNWDIVQEILVSDAQTANKEALSHLNKGANALLFYLLPHTDLSILLNNILLEHISVHFVTDGDGINVFEQLKNVAQNQNISLDKISGSINIDCLENLARTGNWFTHKSADFEAIKNLYNQAPANIKSICINNNLFANAGATLAQQLGIALATSYEYTHQLKLNNVEGFWFNFAISSDYFGEISKLRAFRRLWSHLLQTLSLPQSEAYIYAETALRNKTVTDAHNNIIRTSIEAMAASIGGCDAFSAKGFDITYSEPTAFGERIAKNQQSILQYESHLNKVEDIAKGSYFIEELTENIAQAAWGFFKEIENQGGFLESLKSHWLQNAIEAEAQKEQELFDQQKIVLIGANKHLQADDALKNKLANALFYKAPSQKTEITPIKVQRLAETIEKNL